MSASRDGEIGRPVVELRVGKARSLSELLRTDRRTAGEKEGRGDEKREARNIPVDEERGSFSPSCSPTTRPRTYLPSLIIPP